MKMKKFYKVVLFFCVFFSAEIRAQVSVNPSDEFYGYAQGWHSRGIVRNLPPLRPYPLANVKAILMEAMENGTEKDREIAQEIYDRVTEKPYHVSVETDFFMKREMEEKDDENQTEKSTSKMIALYPAVKGDIGFKDDFVSIGYGAGFAVSNATDTDFMKQNSFSAHDSIYDASEIGPVDMYLDVNEVLAFGKENFYFQGGVYRSGYSSFLNEGLALNDSRYHSGNLAVTFMKGKFSFVQQLSMIGATSSYDGDIGTLEPDKILAFHSFAFDLFPFLSVAYYETSAYGERFDLTYALPVPFMVVQGIGGASDNVAMGILIDVKPAAGIVWETDVMCDDFPADDFFRLNFDSKYRIAARTGLIYSPESSFLERLNFSYTMILPYTYTHWQYDAHTDSVISPATINYQNGTNSGVAIGSQYEPNSDAVKFSVDFRPFRRFTFSVDTIFSRHGNIAETLTDEEAVRYLCAEKGTYATDGSIYMHSMFSGGDHVKSAWNDMNWLNQEHVQYNFQTGVKVRYDFRQTKKGRRVSLKAGVDVEYIHNYGVSGEMFPGGSLDGKYDDGGELIGITYGGTDYLFSDEGDESKIAEIVDGFKSRWKNQLTDRLNVYFNAGVEIRF